MKSRLRLTALAGACVILLAAACAVSVLGAQYPKFPKPILITCTGQDPGALILEQLFERLGIPATTNELIVPSKMGGFKTMIAVTGASLKGLGAAGLDQDEEMERDNLIFKKAKDSGIKIVVAHIEGSARRNEIADKFIVPFVPKADYLLILEESNKDGLFTKLSKQYNIPMTVFKDIAALPEIIKAMFQ